MRIERIVITGGGLAGLRTAAELRAREYAGPITMVGAEPHPPYDRPPLSKKLMLGEVDSTSMADDAAALDLDLRLGETATGLDDGLLRTDQGEIPFSRLVIATGAAPIRLPGPGPQHVLRTIDDALAIRAALRPGIRLAIVGAGWIGAELATVAAVRGGLVTVLEAAQAPAAAALGPAVGGLLAPWYPAAGVDLRLGQPVESVQPGGLALPGGGWLDADLVVTAVGVRPCTGWLEGSGVRLRPATGTRCRWTASSVPRSRGCTRPGTAPRSGPAGTASGCGWSTGTPRCTRPGWPRPTCSARPRSTTRCRTSGPSSSATWSSSPGTRASPTRSSSGVIQAASAGRWAGSGASRLLLPGLMGLR